MRTRKPAVTAVCMLLCMLMLVGLAASSFAEEALAELHVEKNGLTLDLSLLKLEIEDGKLVVSVGIDGITKWKDEEPPKIILDFEQAGEKYTSGLFTADTVAKLPENAKNYKTTSKHPISGSELPDRILIDIGGDEPLVFWEKNPDADAPAESTQTEPPADTEKDTEKDTGKDTGKDAGEDDEQEVLAEVQAIFDGGDYYAAALAASDCAENYPSLWDECDEILEKIADKLKDKEPETGELERHFPFYGMNCVHATAESWPFEMTITDVENPSQFVRFYVRKGDTSEIYLPSSHYYVTISTGDIWFGDDIGFGELGESDDFDGDTLDMTSRVKGNTMSYHEWNPTF
ncbi:MAG: hypothetical protein IKI39_05720 [Oscillospiraceae bacterium]|nr:hypothetical protein [Oscillospiraceae bacterium]